MKKRIEVSDETLAIMAKYNEELRDHPRSLPAFEKALEQLIKEYDRIAGKVVDLDAETEQRIQGLAAYGMIPGRNAFIGKIVSDEVETRLPELEKVIEAELADKKRSFGL
ncbi:hypothetical protein ACXWTF_13075 [Thiomicrolovo sp. ZZH C-3]